VRPAFDTHRRTSRPAEYGAHRRRAPWRADATGLETGRHLPSRTRSTPMTLGVFSISLAVKDLQASRKFYTALGFSDMGGNPDTGYLIMKQGDTLIGLFQGMFEENILTFNPGWDADARELDDYVDVREIQARLEAAGIELIERADPASEGPAHITLQDPDGNAILIDQHR
jgi:catechol 2,3-dioxygenase-like lactoylglutathione lyase family enzyme